ncbi:MAG: 3-deoxy-8-phosphooctulonate synthase [Smithellaceae bacterium]|nr:3-deoxy-8-phosphooctulonate synthase [Smithellaceae bacterium]
MGEVRLNDFAVGNGSPLVLLAGPCVIEDEELTRGIAQSVMSMTKKLGVPFVFKASYDKANRTSINSYRGPGLARGLEILSGIKKDYNLPLISDVHRFEEIDPAAQVLDIIQIPAFLCRQTDFLLEVARTGRIVNIKKGQFLAPWDMAFVIDKILSTGNDRIMITERGACFGYNNLVSDFRGLEIMKRMGYPVIYDATHSVQLPGGAGSASSGQRDMVPGLARAAAAVGVDGFFFEVHPNPAQALCDGPNMLDLGELARLLPLLLGIDRLIRGSGPESAGGEGV